MAHPPSKSSFRGWASGIDEIDLALHQSIACFNLESLSELALIEQRAKALGIRARVSIRVNPAVLADTHRYIATGGAEDKFGISLKDSYALVDQFCQKRSPYPHCSLIGVGAHIGSQLTSYAPYRVCFDRLVALADYALDRGIALTHIDIGGGIGIRYRNEKLITPEGLVARLQKARKKKHCSQLTVVCEPGRSIVGPAGVLLTSVLYLKPKAGRGAGFAIVDAAMNDLLRPALYHAYHQAVPVYAGRKNTGEQKKWEVVGPVCESGDFLSTTNKMALSPGSLLALLNTGAYSMAMSSNYNSRPRAAEVIISEAQSYLAREREQISDLLAKEHWQQF